MRDFIAEIHAELSTVGSITEFYEGWESKWRPIAVSAQGILQVLFPPAAKVIGFLILIVDDCCKTSDNTPPSVDAGSLSNTGTDVAPASPAAV